MKNRCWAMLLPCWAGVCGLAAAQSVTLQASPFAGHYDAREYLQSGALFNREQGRLQGLELRASLQLDAMPGLPVPLKAQAKAWRAEWTHRQSSGLAQYLGLSQTGFPVLTFTQLQWQSSGMALLRQFELGKGHALSLGFGLQHQRHDRYILPGFNLPLQEVLTERAWGWHARYQVQPHLHWTALPQALTLELAASGHKASSSRLDVNAFGVQDPISLHPSGSRHHSASVQASWRFAPGQQLVWHRRLHSGQFGASEERFWTSQGVPTSLVRYPGASLSSNQTALGLAWQW